jgi:chaperonin GroES
MASDTDTSADSTADTNAAKKAAPAGSAQGTGPSERRADKVPVRMLSDRILVKSETSSGERRTNSGILIPATAQLAKRLAWAEVRAVGPNVRAVEEGDHVLYNPEEVYEVEVRGDTYIILRERDLHAVASDRLGEAHTGLYL